MSHASLAVSATARPLPLRMRPDLEIQALRMRGRPQWSVKDPLSLRFFQLREEEIFVLRLLDGRTSIDQIQARFESRFAPRRLEPRRLQAFLGRLHDDGLIVSDLPGQGVELRERRGRLVRREWLETLANILSLRFRGVDPDRFLRRLEPACRWMFSAWFAAACGLLVAAALALVLTHFDVLLARLPEFRDFLRAQNLLWLAVAVAMAKVLHELGHALACQHFGGRCHELGLMLLVFTPCLYCNVSDAWMMPDKWRRIAISAAGMMVEIVLASLAALVWWFSEPGLLNSLAMNLMIVCSLSTLAFNGNPLLRYDGYYILSDLVEVPNLQQQASAVVRRWLVGWGLGIDLPDDRLLPERGRGWLALYAVAATVYRLVVVVVILWCLHRALAPYRLDLLVQAVGLAVIGGMIGVPLFRGAQWIHKENRREPVRWGRFLVRGGLVAAGLAVLLAVPLPYHVTAPLVLQPAGARRVYVTVPGTLVQSLPAGRAVKEGDHLARLQNLELDLEIARLKGDLDRQQIHLSNLERQQGSDPAAAAQIPTARESVADVTARLARRREDAARLTILAPQDGTVLPPPRQSPEPPPGQLPSWTETPLEPANRGAYLETGTLLCLVGNPDSLEAVPVIDQADVDFIRVGQRARIELDEQPSETLWGTVEGIAQLDLQLAPRALAIRGDLPSRIDAAGNSRPLETLYQARVSLDPHSIPLRSGGTGRAKIDAAPQSLGRRLLRYLDRTFQFKW